MIRFLEARPLRKTNAKNIKQFFYNNIISRYSLSDIIIVDKGLEFKKELKEFCETIRVAKVIISVYNP